MSTFQERFKQALGERGYEAGMRRSVQTVLLYEAHRCIADRLASLRPFQRKLAFMDQATALVDSTELLSHQKEEIMWRTGTSKEPMAPETAWKRMKLIEKELEKVQEKVKTLCENGLSHDASCDLFIQQQYESISGTKGKPHPANWEHAHNNVIMCYRMYYSGGKLDPNFPPPIPPKEIVVPAEKPKGGSQPFFIAMNKAGDNVLNGRHETGVQDSEMSAIAGEEKQQPEDRRNVLKEVREHLDLLKEFEGVISQEELNKRKRDLFMALPPAPPAASSRKSTGSILGLPPPSSTKKARTSSDD